MVLPLRDCKTCVLTGGCLPSSECALKCWDAHQSSEHLFIGFDSVSFVHWDSLERRTHCSWKQSELNVLQVTWVLEVTRLPKEASAISPNFGKIATENDGSSVGNCYSGFFQSFCNPEVLIMQFIKVPCLYK